MKNKYIKLISTILILIIIVSISILIYKKFENNQKIQKDNEKFKTEYPKVDKDNLFIYSDINTIINIIENKTGIIYIGFPECIWCQAYVPILNEAAKEEGIEKIYYLNILEDRKNNTINYQKLLNLLDVNLLFDDEGNKRIYVPDVTIVKNGKIIGHNNESSIITEKDQTPEEYWTEERKKLLKENLKESFKKLEKENTNN
jgi:predicted bacteriocin transport accessory protein